MLAIYLSLNRQKSSKEPLTLELNSLSISNVLVAAAIEII